MASRATRSQTLLMATAETQTVVSTIRGLVKLAMPRIERDGLTMVGLSLSNLENDDAVQLPLPFQRRAPRAVDAVVDQVRDRFGARALTRASQLGREEGLTMPMLPD